MRGHSAAGRLLLAGFVLVSGATGSHAQTLTVTAKGSFPTLCTITKSGDFPVNDLSNVGAFSAQATAALNCNTPFKVQVASANGAMVRPIATVPPSFTNMQSYELSFAFQTDDLVDRSASCSSEALKSGVGCTLSTGLTSGASTAINKTATLTASWTVGSATPLLAGSYSDTLTVTLGAQP